MRHLKKLLIQFNVYHAIRLFLAAYFARKTDPYAIASYSQTGEDRIIENYFQSKSGYYIEVGSNHPEYFSNTFSLYKKGWQGISIDANGELIKKHASIRKNDIAICAAVSNKIEELVFTEFEEPLVSSLNSRHIREWQSKRKIRSTRIVTTIDLNSILDKYNAPKKFELLCIDVEGHDFEVISSINLGKYRPNLIVIEMHDFEITNPNDNAIFNYMIENNYKITGYVAMNGYFTDTLS